MFHCASSVCPSSWTHVGLRGASLGPLTDYLASMTLITLCTTWLIGVAGAHYLDPLLALVGLLAIRPLAVLILW